jgi:CSLREA domain-containing protein
MKTRTLLKASVLAAMVCGALAFASPAWAATFTVNQTNDAPDRSPGDGRCDTSTATGLQCSLRAAVQEANALAGADTVNVPAGTFTLGSELSVSSNLTIAGAGAGFTIIRANANSNTAAYRVLNVSGGTVGARGVTIRNGKTSDNGGGVLNSGTLTLTDSAVSGNNAYIGGGLYNAGTLTLTNTTVEGNAAGYGGGGIGNESGGKVTISGGGIGSPSAPNTAVTSGGGVYNSGTDSRVTVWGGARVASNTAGSLGGGLFNGFGGSAVVDGAVIGGEAQGSGNRANGNGGGLYTQGDGSSISLRNATVSGNDARYGGGVYVSSGTATLTGTTASANTADTGGGGVYNGGILNATNSTVSGNAAGYSGGGFYSAYGGTATLTNLTIAANNTGIYQYGAAVINAKNTLLANVGANCAGIVTSQGNNLSDDGTCFSGGTDLRNADPRLGPLSDNGGPTKTYALGANSPAVDAGDDSVIGAPLNLQTDQRGSGFPRKLGVRVDIGAFELKQNVPPQLTLPGGPLDYVEGDSATPIGPDATVTDEDSAGFDGGNVTVSIVANRVAGEDVLGIRNEGTGAGEIGVQGSNVTYGGATIGTFSANDGTLTVALASSATPAATQALVRNLTYLNTSEAPSTTARTVRVTVNDGDGGQDTATVTVNVSGENDPPVLDLNGDGAGRDYRATFTEDGGAVGIVGDAGAGALTVTDPDSESMASATVTLTNRPDDAAETLSIDASGTGISTTGYDTATGVLKLSGEAPKSDYERVLRTVRYENASQAPSTADRRVEFVVNDGEADSERPGSTVVVISVNDPPVAVARVGNNAVRALEDTPERIVLGATDPDGDAPGYEISTLPRHGKLYDGPDEIETTPYSLAGNAVTYGPERDYNASDGPESFGFRATDGRLNSDEAAVEVEVQPVNDAPSFTMGPDQTVNEDSGPQMVKNWATNILSGPPDEAAQKVSFTLANDNKALFSAQPALSPDGTLTYTPARGSHGRATVSVAVSDDGDAPELLSNAAAPPTFVITVKPVNDRPVAAGNAYPTDANRTLRVPPPGLLNNDSDPDGDRLAASLVARPKHGALALRADGSFSYAPHRGYSGTDSFSYAATDGRGGRAAATVRISVRDTIAPRVVRMRLYANPEEAPGRVRLEARFSEAMRAGTVDARTFLLVPKGKGGRKPAAAGVRYSPRERAAVLVPRRPLAPGAYSAKVTGGAKDLAGNGVKVEATWTVVITRTGGKVSRP